MHGENILVSESNGELFLLDVHAATQCAGETPGQKRVQNLAFLCNSMASCKLGAREQMRFIRAYLDANISREALQGVLSQVSAQRKLLHERHLRSRSKRCLKHSSEFTHERTPLGLVYRQRAMSLAQISQAVDLHHAVLAGEARGQVAKRHIKTNISIIEWDGTLNADRLCVKEFVRPEICRFLMKCVKHRNALAAWQASLGLRVRRISAPEALAVALGGGVHSYLIMRAVSEAERLADYVSRALGPEAPVSCRRAFLRAAAETLEKVYAAGVAHGDMKATNVLVRKPAKGERCEFVLLDLDAVRFPRQLGLKHKLLNLAQLNAALPLALTWADRLRFLRRLADSDAALQTREAIDEIGRLTLERSCVWR